MRICRSEENNISNSSIESLPDDVLINEVLRRVAASSIPTILNLKLSCKNLREMCEDKCIYQHVTLDKIPIVEWRRLRKGHQAFLKKCKKFGNPEMMYRLALVDYVTEVNPNLKSIHEKLDRAQKQGHFGALYVKCIILLLSGDEDLKREAIKLLSGMKKSTFSKRNLLSCRTKMINEVSTMWVNNPLLKERPVMCCTAKHQRPYKNPFGDEEKEEDVNYECHACNADAEIDCIYAYI